MKRQVTLVDTHENHLTAKLKPLDGQKEPRDTAMRRCGLIYSDPSILTGSRADRLVAHSALQRCQSWVLLPGTNSSAQTLNLRQISLVVGEMHYHAAYREALEDSS